MDINRVRYFLSLARTGSMSKAAEAHRISSAAFSKAIRIFEEEMGVKLIVPHGRGILLTDQAHSLALELTAVVEKLDSIREKANNVSVSNRKNLRVATFEVFSTHFFEAAMDSGFRDYDLDLRELTPGKIEEAVANRTSDFGLTYIPIPHPDIDALKVAPIEMGVYGRHDLKTGREFSTFPFAVPITPIEGSPNKVRGLDGWPDNAIRRNIQYRVQMMESALGLCRRGLAVAYLPKFVVDLHNETVKPEFQLKELKSPLKSAPNPTSVYLLKRKADTENGETKKMAALIRKLCK